MSTFGTQLPQQRVRRQTQLLHHVLVSEQRGYWSRGLRRELAGSFAVKKSAPFTESVFRDWQDKSELAWATVIVVAPEWHLAEWQAFDELRRLAPQMLLMTIVEPHDVLGLHWSVALGAQAVLRHLWQIPQAASVIRRFWSGIPTPALSLQERIWNNLPWA